MYPLLKFAPHIEMAKIYPYVVSAGKPLFGCNQCCALRIVPMKPVTAGNTVIRANASHWNSKGGEVSGQYVHSVSKGVFFEIIVSLEENDAA